MIKKKQKTFKDYMNYMWLDTQQTWEKICALFTQSQKNALESTNNVIKQDETLRERSPLSKFLTLCIKIAEIWSR